MILSSSNLYSQESIDVMISCVGKNPDGSVIPVKNFIEGLNREGMFLGKDSVKLLKEIKLPHDTTLLGPSELYKAPKVHMIRVSLDKVKKYIDRVNKSNPLPGIAPPSNTLEVFNHFQMMTAGACDFIVPTRFKILHAVKSKKDKEITKLKDDLSQCLAKVEEVKSNNKGTAGDVLRNDIKEIEKKLIDNTNSTEVIEQ